MTVSLDIRNPSYPLSQAAFGRALRTGHGRAWTQVFEHGADGLADTLLEFAVMCPVFDTQCEDERGDWIAQLIIHSGLQHHAIDRIADSINHPPIDSLFWSRAHRAQVLLEFAKQSVPRARELVYRSLARDTETDDVIGAEEIVELDGKEGLEIVAAELGKWLEEDPNWSANNNILYKFDEVAGKGAGLKVLQDAAIHNFEIARYLAALEDDTREIGAQDFGLFKTSKKRPNRIRQKRVRQFTAQEILSQLRSNEPNSVSLLMSWMRKTDDRNRRIVFDALLHETDPSRIQTLLRVFMPLGFPIFNEKLLEWVDHPERYVRHFLLQALSKTPDPRIRQLAIARLESEVVCYPFIELFTRNYQPGDHQHIENALRMYSDENDLHWQICDIINVFEFNRFPEGVRSMLFSYEFSPCTNCRLKAVRWLYEMGVAPEWVLEESRHDGSREIRAFVNGIQR